MKAKLILMSYNADGDDRIYDLFKEKDFEDITKEELKILKDNLHLIPPPDSLSSWEYFWAIIVQDEERIKNRIRSIKEILESTEIKKAEAKKRAEEKKKLKLEEKLKNKEKTDREKEIKLAKNWQRNMD